MNKLVPEPLWAVMLAFLGVILAICCLFRPTPDHVVLAILAIASNLVSGALGAFAAHATPHPQQPEGPAQPQK